MRPLLAVAFLATLAVGCGGGSGSPLTRDWIHLNSDLSAFGLTLDPDGTYVQLTFVITADTALSVDADAETEKGAYSVAGSQITFVPQASSCPGPIPAYALNYAFSGSSLVLSGGSNILTFTPNDSQGATKAFTIRSGCFVNGVLSPRPVASVSN